MPRQASSAPLLGLARASLAEGAVLHRQLYGRVRELVLSGRLAPELKARMDDRAAAARAAAGLATPPLSSCYLKPGATAPPEQGLLLGYAAVSEPEIEAGIVALARALR